MQDAREVVWDDLHQVPFNPKPDTLNLEPSTLNPKPLFTTRARDPQTVI